VKHVSTYALMSRLWREHIRGYVGWLLSLIACVIYPIAKISRRMRKVAVDAHAELLINKGGQHANLYPIQFASDDAIDAPIPA